MTDPQHPPSPLDLSNGPAQALMGPDGTIVPPDQRPIAGRRVKMSEEPDPNRPLTNATRTRMRTYTSTIGANAIPHAPSNSSPLFRSPLYVSNQSTRHASNTGEGDDTFDATSEGNHDEYETAIHAGRKKRKTPAFQMSSGPGRHEGFAVYDGDVVDGTDRHADLPPLIPGHEDREERDEENDGHDRDRDDEEGGEGDDGIDPIDAAESATLALQRQIRTNRRLRSISTQSCDFRRLQFLRRKAALITLFLDATSAIKSYWKDEKPGGAHTKSLVTKLPEVDAFEKLLPALEDVGVGEWPPDKPEWRNGYDDQFTKRRLGVWRTKFAKRRKIREGRKEIVRGGWAPEGSFELEVPSKCKLRSFSLVLQLTNSRNTSQGRGESSSIITTTSYRVEAYSPNSQTETSSHSRARTEIIKTRTRSSTDKGQTTYQCQGSSYYRCRVE
jgi:hypothetical protein